MRWFISKEFMSNKLSQKKFLYPFVLIIVMSIFFAIWSISWFYASISLFVMILIILAFCFGALEDDD